MTAQANTKRWKAPDSLSDAIDMLADLCGKYEAAETRAEEAECELTAWCVDLACIHMKLKAGRIDEAKDDLDWLLQKVDSDGRYRMSAVISKHPVLPGI